MPTPAPRALALRTTGVTYPGTADQVRAVRADLRTLLAGCPMADDWGIEGDYDGRTVWARFDWPSP
jgi:hypothetical protein